MKRKILFLLPVFFLLLALIVSCNFFNSAPKETILTGEVTILVDETVFPVIEDQVAVFESQYEGKIHIKAMPEREIVKLLSEGKYNLAVLTRELTPSESLFFTKKHISAVATTIGFDGIAFITNKINSNLEISTTDVTAFMNNNPSRIKNLVFDNSNSSTVSFLNKNQVSLSKGKVFSLNNTNEVIHYISQGKATIGVIGVNWLTQPYPEMSKSVSAILTLPISDARNNKIVLSQASLGNSTYPYIRKIKMINFQGGTGLGMGFASFMAGEIGQRIVLKAGLIPVRMPSRNIIVRKQI